MLTRLNLESSFDANDVHAVRAIVDHHIAQADAMAGESDVALQRRTNSPGARAKGRSAPASAKSKAVSVLAQRRQGPGHAATITNAAGQKIEIIESQSGRPDFMLLGQIEQVCNLQAQAEPRARKARSGDAGHGSLRASACQPWSKSAAAQRRFAGQASRRFIG